MHLKIESACNGLFLKERDKGYYGRVGKMTRIFWVIEDEGYWPFKHCFAWQIRVTFSRKTMVNEGCFCILFFFNPKSPFIIVYNKQVLVVNKKLTFIATWIIMSAFILWIISDQLVDGMQNLCNEQRVSSLAS